MTMETRDPAQLDQPGHFEICPGDLVIFDCDGVLVDSELISNRVLSAMLVDEGLPITPTQARREYQGLLLADVVAQAEVKLGRALLSDWLARFERERSEAFQRELRPVAGAAEAVERIAAAGIRVCVASQAKLSKTQMSLALTGLDRFFPDSTQFSSESVAHGKPAPDLFLYAAKAMRAEPSRCVVVEDTPSGVTAARSAGMRSLGYSADSDGHALRDAGAEILNSLDELPGVLGLS
jgi:HAD superfamily hydrolase (TIGR01509 family)